MIAVVSTTYQEADIVGLWVSHLLAEGVDLILVADKLGNDGTRDILEHWRQETGQLQWFDDTEESHRQAWWTDKLAFEAHEQGADWILPADVDEFPYATNGGTVADALNGYSGNKVYMHAWPHKDINNRFVDHHRMPKVAYRWSPDAHVTMGSHDVSLPSGDYDVLDLRELKYRSFEHFCNKVADRNATLEPAARARGDGAHHLWLENKSRKELEIEWRAMIAVPTIYDPIPSHQNTGLDQRGTAQ